MVGDHGVEVVVGGGAQDGGLQRDQARGPVLLDLVDAAPVEGLG
ncbi:hypothetical protein [Embleya scabrispora]|nr:hypothetical protein [Embleya scabrispora]